MIVHDLGHRYGHTTCRCARHGQCLIIRTCLRPFHREWQLDGIRTNHRARDITGDITGRFLLKAVISPIDFSQPPLHIAGHCSGIKRACRIAQDRLHAVVAADDDKAFSVGRAIYGVSAVTMNAFQGRGGEGFHASRFTAHELLTCDRFHFCIATLLRHQWHRGHQQHGKEYKFFHKDICLCNQQIWHKGRKKEWITQRKYRKIRIQRIKKRKHRCILTLMHQRLRLEDRGLMR